MKVYLASPQPPEHLKIFKHILFSYWDLTDGPVPFRRFTWKAILSEREKYTNISHRGHGRLNQKD